MTETDADPPKVEIRARPPSPKRLSRTVLLGGALAAGAIAAFALLNGLSDRKDLPVLKRTPDAPIATPAPPETLRDLPSQYDRKTMRAPAGEGHDMLWGERGPPDGWKNPRDEVELAPPEDPFWAGKASPQPKTAPSTEKDIEKEAAASGILFAAGLRDRSGEKPKLSTQADRTGTSSYTIHAGAIVPAALVTALNADVPGRVIAQVTSPVFDSSTGQHLLIPQGARLLGAYDSKISYGDRRVFLVWERLIMPDGTAVTLEGMDATDSTGAAGLSDRIDNHWNRLAVAIGTSAFLSVLGNEAEDDGDSSGLTQSMGDAAAQEAARVGGRMVEREMQVKPTLRVRAGAPVRVVVTREIKFSEFSGSALE